MPEQYRYKVAGPDPGVFEGRIWIFFEGRIRMIFRGSDPDVFRGSDTLIHPDSKKVKFNSISKEEKY